MIFCWHLEDHEGTEQDLDSNPDPLARGTDPRIRTRIRTKMSRILYTGLLYIFVTILAVFGRCLVSLYHWKMVLLRQGDSTVQIKAGKILLL